MSQEGSHFPAWRPCMFYKLIVASILQDKKMKIPGKFVKKYGGDMSSIAVLSVPGGSIWTVELENVKGKLWFCKGWQEFLMHFSIGDGYLLVFRYEGKSKFGVNIFDLTTSEIKYPPKIPDSLQKSQKNPCLTPHESDLVDAGLIRTLASGSSCCSPVPFSSNFSDEDGGYNSAHSKDNGAHAKKLHPRNEAYRSGITIETSWDISTQVCNLELTSGAGEAALLVSKEAKRRTNSQQQRSDSVHIKDVSESEKPAIKKSEMKSPCETARRGLRTVTTEERNSTINAAYQFKPENPFFRVILQPSHVHGVFKLHIPVSFGQRYLSSVTGFIKLEVSDGEQWPVQCIYGNGIAFLSRGWRAFVWDNKLEEGDVCVFELIDRSDIALKVKIFRVVEDARLIVQPSEVKSATSKGSFLTSNKAGGRTSRDKQRTELDEPEPQATQKAEIKSSCFEISSEASMRRSRAVTTEEKDRAVQAAYAFKPDNPFFRSVMRTYNVYRFLNIPASFARRYLSRVVGFIKLEVSDGKNWPVRCVYGRNTASFSQGWRAFARDNKLEEGDVCVFELIGTSDLALKVTIFRVLEDAAPIDQPSKVKSYNSKGRSLTSDGAEEGRTCYKKRRTEFNEPEQQTSQKAETKSSCFGICSETSMRRSRAVTAEEKNRAFHAACAFRPYSPYFRSIMQPNNVYRTCVLHVPVSFSWRYLRKVTGFIKLQVSDEKEWPVRCIYRNGRASLSRGWKAFAQDNRLEEGDVCVFELNGMSGLALKVTIFRVPEDATQMDQPSGVNCFEVNSTTNKGCLLSEGAEGRTRSKKRRSELGADEPEPQATQKAEIKLPSVGVSSETSTRRLRTATTEKRDTALYDAYALKPDNPFFTSIMRPYNVCRNFFLYIPGSFAQRYLSGIAGFVKLQISDGKQWLVRCIQGNAGAYLSGGWGHFAKHNTLEEGDVCIFELINTSDIVLKVTIFRVPEDATPGSQPSMTDCSGIKSLTDKGGLLCPGGADAKPRSKRRKTEHDKSLPETVQNPELYSRCPKTSSGTSFRGLRAITTEENDRAVHAAYAFKPENPFFRSIMRPYNVDTGFPLRIPCSFSQRYLSRVRGFIKLQDSEGKQWPCRCIYQDGCARLSQGWRDFARGKKLEEGDICVFELISSEDIVLKVTIFPVVEDSKQADQLPTLNHALSNKSHLVVDDVINIQSE